MVVIVKPTLADKQEIGPYIRPPYSEGYAFPQIHNTISHASTRYSQYTVCLSRSDIILFINLCMKGTIPHQVVVSLPNFNTVLLDWI